jgi:hypothetical protein
VRYLQHLNLGGDPWPIYIDPTGENNVIDEYKSIVKPGAHIGVEVNLKPGDMLIYSGCELEHWRKPFEGNLCGQVFLHYNHSKWSLCRRAICMIKDLF